jgi:hypothetical protein
MAHRMTDDGRNYSESMDIEGCVFTNTGSPITAVEAERAHTVAHRTTRSPCEQYPSPFSTRGLSKAMDDAEQDFGRRGFVVRIRHATLDWEHES